MEAMTGGARKGGKVQGKGKKETPEERQRLKVQEEEQEEKKARKGYTILKDINIKVKKGEFVGIIGKVGSGKTSLVNALLNEMHLEKGTVHLNPTSKVALITQSVWLRNTTLRNNILFGNAYEETRYLNILKICELNPDLDQLEGGDMTEIGERGINLSGGQKQRIAIARAVYSDADIYIIDDCLSALDNFVSNKVFNNVLKTHLAGKTRIFVTHALQYIPGLDRIYVMKEGEIAQNGTFQSLQQQGGEFDNLMQTQKQEEMEEDDGHSNEQQSIANMIEQSIQEHESLMQSIPNESNSCLSFADEHQSYNQQQVMETKEEKEGNNKISRKASKQSAKEKYKESDSNVEMVNVMPSKTSMRKKSSMKSQQMDSAKQDTKKQQGALTATETKKTGAVNWDVYKFYMQQSGMSKVVFVLFMYFVTQCALIFNDIWLGLWSQDSSKTGSSKEGSSHYLIGFVVISMLTALSVYVRGFFLSVFIHTNAVRLQKTLIMSIFRSPMGWFDVTPSGRILNRTNKDQDDIDTILPWTLSFCIQNIFSLVSYLLLVSVIFPYFLVIFVVVSIVFIYATKKYMRVAREVKRIEAMKRAPALSLIGEASYGSVLIRNYKREDIYMEMVKTSFDNYIIAAGNTFMCSRWISIVSDSFSSILIGSVAVLAVLSKEINYTDNVAFVGVALTNVFKVTSIMSFTIKILADTELQFNAVERMKEYIDKPEVEASWDSPEVSEPDWPSRGVIVASNLRYKYRADTPYVIKGLSFKIESFQKVGVVGRTGSGKSTLTLGLLRILELQSEDNGSLVIDGVDISKIGLHHLRQKLSIIPQDPFLFTGTLRKNVDPFDEYSDKAIMNSLKAVTIWTQIGNEDMTEQQRLQFEITDGGSNFSLGQRQLICMSRSILRKSRVLIMDEATASIDEATDHVIQTMIQQEFSNTTVLTIAHRINTIINYDKLMILDQGNIVQFDTPYNLLMDKTGYFHVLVMESGQEYFDQLLSMINKQ